MNHVQTLIDVIALVRRASIGIMEIYRQSDLGIETKADHSPLTAADLHAHTVLAAGLIKLNMGPILSEEGNEVSWEDRKQWQQYWLIDPIDGTKEFIKRNGEFTVNVALIHKGTPVLGVVYAPAKDLLYYGACGLGAFKQEKGKKEQAIKPSPLPQRSEAWRIAGSRSHPSKKFQEFIHRFGKVELLAIGSSLKLCLIADGSLDLYPRFGPTCEWDTGAAQAVVEAAGGVVLNADTGKALKYNSKESLLNPFFIVCAQTSPLWHKDS